MNTSEKVVLEDRRRGVKWHDFPVSAKFNAEYFLTPITVANKCNEEWSFKFAGYLDVLRKATCEEPDDCASGNHNCDQNATCTPKPPMYGKATSGFRCECKVGIPFFDLKILVGWMNIVNFFFPNLGFMRRIWFKPEVALCVISHPTKTNTNPMGKKSHGIFSKTLD